MIQLVTEKLKMLYVSDSLILFYLKTFYRNLRLPPLFWRGAVPGRAGG